MINIVNKYHLFWNIGDCFEFCRTRSSDGIFSTVSISFDIQKWPPVRIQFFFISKQRRDLKYKRDCCVFNIWKKRCTVISARLWLCPMDNVHICLKDIQKFHLKHDFTLICSVSVFVFCSFWYFSWVWHTADWRVVSLPHD